MDRRRIWLPAAAAALFLLTACGGGGGRLDVNVSDIPDPNIVIHRYDVDLFRVDPANLRTDLEKLKPQYPFFLGADLSDTARLNAMHSYLLNPRNVAFHKSADSVYPDLTGVAKELDGAFRHLQFHYPGAKVPRFYSYISGGDYDYPVQFADSVMIIGIDNFLGGGFRPYASDGLPAYRTAEMTRAHIVPGCMEVLFRIMYPDQVPSNNLLGRMVEEGKRMLFIEAMVPGTDPGVIFGYADKQCDWIVKNEQHVWAAIIENRMLYTTDGKLIRTFMSNGPFTAEFSKEAPSRLGEWIGWKIVRAYYNSQPNVTLDQVMKEPDPQKILSLSGYKPEK